MTPTQRQALPWPQVGVHWLAHGDMGATLGSAVEITVAPSDGYDVHRHRDVERVVHVLSGSGTHKGTGGSLALVTGDTLVLRPGDWHGFHNDGGEPAKLWIMYAPAVRFPDDDYEVANPAATFGGDVIRHRLREVADDPSITVPANGFIELRVIWDGAKGATGITFGIAWFKEGGQHKWHRHPSGDEVIYIAKGTSHHLTDAGDLTLIGPAYAFSPANEWHAMSVDSDVECYFAYLGGRSLDDVGYERRAM